MRDIICQQQKWFFMGVILRKYVIYTLIQLLKALLMGITKQQPTLTAVFIMNIQNIMMLMPLLVTAIKWFFQKYLKIHGARLITTRQDKTADMRNLKQNTAVLF